MNPDKRAYIGLGANLAFEGMSALVVLAQAMSAIKGAGFLPLGVSNVWQSAAWPPSDQPDFYNAVAVLDPRDVSPQALYQALRGIELRFGRERRERWAARTLDLDILAMDEIKGTFGDVTIPHPRMHERAFVLAPLSEVAPNWRHPNLGLTAAQMLKTVPKEQRYRRFGPLAGG